MTFARYWYFIRRHWAKLLLLLCIVPGVVLVGSVALLIISPKYVSMVDVSLLPSEGEISFTRDFLGGNRGSQVNALDKTIREYIKSRPVITRAIEIASANARSTAEPPPEYGELESIVALYHKTQVLFGKLYNVVNSGRFIEPDPKVALVAKYERAVDVYMVEGSFILRIRVELSDPDEAAAFANALAQAYSELSAERAAAIAQEIKKKLDEEIRLRQAALEDLATEEFDLRREGSALSVVEERLSLIKTLESERLSLTADMVEREQLDTRLAYFERQQARERKRGVLENIELEISAINARREELDRRIQVRSKVMSDMRVQIDRLAENERPFLKFKHKNLLIEQEIESLREPIAMLELAESKAAGKVQIVNTAEPAPYPDSPKVISNTILGGVAGLLLVCMAVVLLDAGAQSVLTVGDLRRVFGERALGVLPGQYVEKMARSDWNLGRTQWQELRDIGADLEQKLAVLGELDGQVIVVTGFGSDKLVSGTAMTAAASIALRGIRVTCGLADWETRPTPPGDRVNGNLTLNDPGARTATNAQIHFRCIEPISANFRWMVVTRRCDSMICAVPSGQIAEERLEEFRTEAARNGVERISFVLVETASHDLIDAS